MVRRCLAMLAVLVAAPAFAQSPAVVRFAWTQGQVLTYTVKQTTAVTETTLEEGTNKPATGTTKTALAITKRWEVKGVDAAGVATLEVSVTAMRQEIVRPGLPDSVVIDTATPEGQRQTAAFLNKPVVTVKVDATGRLVDAKSTVGSAERLRAELPFRLTLPEQPPATGGSWGRPFTIVLEPPLGAGEKHDAVQTYTLKGENAGVLSVGVATALKAAPMDAAELPALVPLLWEGEILFDRANGRYAGARLSVKKEVANHQGEGTKFVYESEYVEELVK